MSARTNISVESDTRSVAVHVLVNLTCLDFYRTDQRRSKTCQKQTSSSVFWETRAAACAGNASKDADAVIAIACKKTPSLQWHHNTSAALLPSTVVRCSRQRKRVERRLTSHTSTIIPTCPTLPPR